MNARIPDAFESFVDGQGSGQAFNFTEQDIMPSWNPGPSTVGSSLGVPPATGIAGMDATGSGTAAPAAYASAVNSGPTIAHPVLWAFIIFFAGIVLLGYVSHIEAKRRG